MAEENENQEGLFSKENVKNAAQIVDGIKEVRSAVNDANKALEKFGEGTTNISKEFGVIQSGASKVAAIQNEAANSTEATAKALGEQVKQQNAVESLNARINEYYEKAATLSGEAANAVLDQAANLTAARDKAQALADTFGNIADDAAKLDKRTSFFSSISSVVSDIPGLRKLASPFQDAAKAAREAVVSNSKGGKKVSVLAAGAKGLAKSAASSAMSFFKSGGFIGVIAIGLQKAVKLMLDIDKTTSKTAKALDISKKEAAAFAFNAMAAADGMDLTAERIDGATIQAANFSNQTGLSNQNIAIFNGELDSLEHKLGLSAEQTAEMATLMVATGTSAGDFRSEMLGTLALQKQSLGVGVTTKALMQDIAGASAAFKVNSGMSSGALAKAAVQARKVGLSFSQLENISEGLLDFQGSIEKEMQAQLMTGKEINLDKARQFALEGNLGGVASEIAKQEAVREAFATNNVLAQKSVADSLGISREELAKMYTSQQALEKSGFKSAEDRQAQYETYLKTMTQAEALEKIGDKEFKRITEQASFQDKINTLLENMKKIFMISIAPTVERVLGYFVENKKFLTDIVDKTRVFATSLMSPDGTLTNMKENFMGVYNTLKGIGLIIKAVLINPLAAAYHTIAATVSGLQEAYYYTTLQFDKAKEAGKASEKHSALAVANLIDVGTNVIKGGALIGGNEELGNADTMVDMVNDSLPVKDFTIKPLGEDTITMAGGTKLGGNVEALLEELIAIVKGGGHVYLDGSKVGETLVLNSKLSN